jgi:hypothetical protein
MYPTSNEFRAAIATSHIAVSKAEVWSGENRLSELAIESGNVEVNTASAIRRTCQVTLVTDRTTANLVPDTQFDLLTPFGNELKLYRGVEFSDGSREYIPLGVFVITDVNISDRNEGVVIELTGEDRALIVARNKWTAPYQVTSGALETAIENLLENRYPGVIVSLPTTNVTINQVILGVEKDNDPWQDAVEICQLVGYDLFFDATGAAVMKQFPTLDGTSPIATFVEGSGTTVTSLTRNLSTKETYNGVIYYVEGTNVSSPIRVEVWDEDPSSPTYRYGKFGQVPTFVDSNIVSSSSAAITAATLLLNTYIGAQEKINWEGIVNPALDVQDIVYVKTSGAKVDRVVILDSLSIPLSSTESMSSTARTVRLVDSGETII